MLQHDYLLDIIIRFVELLSRALRRAVLEKDGDGCIEAERAVAGLLGLDPDTASILAPQSLVQLMILSGMGEGLAAYVGYALDRVADIYEERGEDGMAGLRRAQAEAIAGQFGCDLAHVPEELDALDRELFG